MSTPHRLTAIIEREADGYASLCPELDIASQGSSIEEARANLVEALTLFLKLPIRTKSPSGPLSSPIDDLPSLTPCRERS